MLQVLWISRHQMTTAQFADLERVLGEPVKLTCWTHTVYSIESLEPMICQADAIAVVLPACLLAQLVQKAVGRPVLQSVAARQPTGRIITLPDGRTEPEFAFIHRGWQQVIYMEMEVKDLFQ